MLISNVSLFLGTRSDVNGVKCVEEKPIGFYVQKLVSLTRAKCIIWSNTRYQSPLVYVVQSESLFPNTLDTHSTRHCAR